MAWLKIDQSLLTHRKTMMLAESLDIHEMQAVGHLVALWAWALDNAPSGELPETDRIIARAAQWDGAPAHFTGALADAGFVDDEMVLWNWDKIRPYDHRWPTRRIWEIIRSTVAPLIYKRDGKICRFCNTIDDLTIDHIVPLSKGGTNEMSNLQVLCRSCNSSKKDKFPYHHGMD